MLIRHFARVRRLALAIAVLLTASACDPEAEDTSQDPQPAAQTGGFEIGVQNDTLVPISEIEAVAGGSGDLTAAPLRTFRGRVGIDISDITARWGFLDMPWSIYHQFRRHFDPATGAPITADAHVPGAMIPIPATIEISYFYGDNPTALCPDQTVQSDRDGFFTFTLSACPSYLPFRTPDMIIARVVLDYEVRGAIHPEEPDALALGLIRGLWDDARAQQYYPHNRGPIVYTDGDGKEMVQPRFTAIFNPHNVPQPGHGASFHDLGTQDLRPGFPAQIEGSFSMTLSNWQKVVEMHHRLHEEFLAVDDVATYLQMFVDHAPSNCWGCYSVKFDAPGTSSHGGYGTLLMAPPTPDIVWVDGIHPIGHEFGHSIHAAIAPGSYGSSKKSYAFANGRIDSNGNETYGVHHDYEHQEMGTAYSEGIATTLGEYLANGCDANWREGAALNGPPPDRDRSLRAFETCDEEADCSYHNFRWQMAQRGVAEGSAEWEHRQQLADSANSAYGNTNWNFPAIGGRRYITSNGESRVARFGCDLLTPRTDIRHDDGERAGMQYTFDGYVYLHGRALDGLETSYEIREYAEDVQPKTFQLSLPELLEAMDEFVPASAVFPPIGDPDFPDKRLSVRGHLSPQNLGLHLKDEGHLTRAELNNVLRANFMEEATWRSPGQGELTAAFDEDLPMLVQDPQFGPAPVEPDVILTGSGSGPAPTLQPSTGFQTLR